VNHAKLKLAFAGTPELARIVLKSLIDTNQHNIGIVFTKPDRPAGRGHKIKQSEVKICAIENNIQTFQPENSRDLESYYLENYDLLLVVAYGLLLTPKALAKPKFGCINIHTSLLPHWRGAAPIQRAIEAGDKKTGITITQMDKNLDTGPILKQIVCPISNQDTSGSLHARLADISAANIHDALEKIASRKINAIKQDDSKATYAKKISKQDAKLDWNRPAKELERKIRAYNPSPIAHTTLKGITMRVWEAKIKPATNKFKPGTILSEKSTLDVVTSQDLLSITKLQLPGKKIILAKDFLNGHADFISNKLDK
jgi:methionyl-tRNA formyltransferase|tara:strand:+ start:1711 stop:2649 length:939 start_codon:yes stop_codon:yes gene_type:complete